jgi:two-component system, OmpR family, sensor kinase
MVDELVDAARLQSGKALDLVLGPTDLVALTERVVAQHAAAGRYAFKVEAAKTHVLGQWDAARLERVLDNLISNAVKYGRRDTTVWLTVTREAHDGRWWGVVTVKDEGIGIPPADVPRLFQPFQRASNAAGRAPGSGLGLAGVKAIVEQHGGAVRLVSVEGEGTTVSVQLPLD